MKKYFEKIFKGSLSEFSVFLEQCLEEERKAFIVTANPETLMIAEKNSEFQKILLAENTIITADGIGVVKGAQMLGYPINERVTGVDIVKELLVSADKKKKSLYLFGAKPEVVSTLAKKIEVKYKGIQLLGYTDGYVDDKERIFRQIIDLKPDITLVALGIPAQELLIQKHFTEFDKGIFIGVGGSFDVLSGLKNRAPDFFVNHNLEWLYRICKEPKRFKRFYQSNIKYIKIIKKMRKEGQK